MDFAEVATFLHALTGKYVRFQWNDECQVAFERLKAALPILAMPTDGYPTRVGRLLAARRISLAPALLRNLASFNHTLYFYKRSYNVCVA